MRQQTQEEKKIELLAPGGDEHSVKAAILAGADAVYCGLPAFNARQRAENITPGKLEELVLIAHQHGCRIFVTLNTLIVEEEIDEVLRLLTLTAAMGIDAVIVQDAGLLYLIREYFPSLEVHASTQMTTHNTGQLDLLSGFGVSQANLCRELALPEIQLLCSHGRTIGLKSEVFIHGAYCISFSGQCYMSSAMSGRSGNRGACVQPCRRIYRYGSSLRSKGTPFNLKDNSAFSRCGKLITAGMSSLKIEGRIKNYKYVFAAVSAWRRQLEMYFRSGMVSADDNALGSVFNRSFTSGYLDGEISPSMFSDSSRDRSLVPVSAIRSYTADTGVLTLVEEALVDPDTPVLVYGPGFTFICTGFCRKRTGRFEYQFTISHKLKGK